MREIRWAVKGFSWGDFQPLEDWLDSLGDVANVAVSSTFIPPNQVRLVVVAGVRVLGGTVLNDLLNDNP